jgi:hypothetical protein
MRTKKRGSLFLCFFVAMLAAGAQDRKPGLYELTLNTTTVSPNPSVSGTRVTQVCLTQEMIDKYGAIVPQNLSNICQIVNVVKKSGGMTADISCAGTLSGKGTLEVNWTDSEHTKGKINFSGSMHPGDKEIKIEWSAVTSSAYKAPDCSALKPATPATPPPTPPPAAP